jgi:hypothetical protein
VTPTRAFGLNWVLLILLTSIAVAPLAYPGFLQAHSGFLPAWNLHDLDQAGLHAGWTPELGRLPDPVRGEGPLPYVLTWPLLRLSGSATSALRLGYALTFWLGATFLFAWARRWLGDRGGLLAAVAYTYLPWHVATVYVRGAYAEAWLWVWVPLLLWAADGVMAGRFRTGLLGLVAVLGATWTHRGLMVLILVLLCAYAVAVLGRPRRWQDPLTAALGGLGVAVLVGLVWTSVRLAPRPGVPFAEHGLYPFQLTSAAWGFGASVAGWADGISFQLGLAAAGLGLIGVVLYTAKRPEQGFLRRTVSFWALATLLVSLSTLKALAPVWRFTGLEKLLTYPWQLLLLAAPGLAFLAGLTVRADRRLARLPAWAGLVGLVVLASYPYLAPRFTQVQPKTAPLAILHAPDVAGPQLSLVQADLAPSAAAEITTTLTVTLTWQVIQPLERDYTVFVHLLSTGDEKLAQQDSQPVDGTRPTHTWQPGEIVQDPHTLALPFGPPADTARIAVGMYSLATDTRLKVQGRSDDRVLLDVP